MSEKLRTVLFKEDGPWVAQVLEHDICVQASTLDELQKRLAVVVRLEKEEPGGLDRIGPAPARFQNLWEARHDGVLRMNYEVRT